jgi:FMN-dependent NADH-azoreductase
MRVASLIFVAGLVSGCSATFKQNVLQEPSTKLMRGKSVAIATPANGWYGKEPPEAKSTGDNHFLSSFFC